MEQSGYVREMSLRVKGRGVQRWVFAQCGVVRGAIPSGMDLREKFER